jgi:CubicO group peptidase (beta-lactamase class C family)
MNIPRFIRIAATGDQILIPKNITCTLLAVALLMSACNGGGSGTPRVLETVPASGEKWTLAAPGEVGMDGAILQQAADAHPGWFSSIIVLRHGKPVLEQYWNGFGKDNLHEIRSATKSITSLMTGIAIDKGMLKGVDQPISELLGAAYPGRPALTRNITVGNMLTMSSGLDCDDFNEASPGHQKNMYPTKDWVNFILTLPQLSAPGTSARYCTGGVTTLGRAVSEASKQSVPAFAEQHLLAPLGIKAMKWTTYDSGRHASAGGLAWMRPRDMAKIGQLVLQKGQWEGRQIVSEAWIAQSTRAQTVVPRLGEYGYLWWVSKVVHGDRTLPVHFADGNGGQYIVVIPDLDVVAVITGEAYDVETRTAAFKIVNQYIVGAVK